MNNRNSDKKSLRRQLISGTVYVALAAVVVAVTLNTTVGLLSGTEYEMPDTDGSTDLGLSDIAELPRVDLPPLSLTIPEADVLPDTSPVADTPSGIDSEITEASDTETVVDIAQVPTIPDDADLGIDRFIKPCDGYVLKEHSADLPVYSTTLSDYRIHIGVDVTGEIGTPVLSVCGGVVTDIYDDDLYGKTVCVQNRSGYTVKYSNLLPTLNANIAVGTLLSTGDVIGGIGDTALCEAVESSHLHLEMYDENSNAVNPEHFISF